MTIQLIDITAIIAGAIVLMMLYSLLCKIRHRLVSSYQSNACALKDMIKLLAHLFRIMSTNWICIGYIYFYCYYCMKIIVLSQYIKIHLMKMIKYDVIFHVLQHHKIYLMRYTALYLIKYYLVYDLMIIFSVVNVININNTRKETLNLLDMQENDKQYIRHQIVMNYFRIKLWTLAFE